jgi:hypothetical protein
MGTKSTILATILIFGSLACSTLPGSNGHRADGPILEATPPASPPTLPQAITSGSNIRVNQDASGEDQNETAVAVSPTNPLNLVAAARDRRNGIERNGFYSSLDGGATWTDGVLTEGTYTYQSDPVVAACADGSFVYASLSFNSGGSGGVFAYRSTDGGRTWPQKSTVVTASSIDKEWIACDATASSPYANRIYVGYRDISGAYFIRVKRSTDGGVTWSTPVIVPDVSLRVMNGIALATGPAGQLYAAWFDFTTKQVKFDVSTDGGATFGTDKVLAEVTAVPEFPHLSRPNSLPAIAVDLSGGPYHGYVYVLWTGYQNGDCDVRFLRSADGGATWTPLAFVNDNAVGNGSDEFFPGVTVDPLGRVIVTFHSTRRAPGTDHYELWGAISRDGGQTFDTNFLISDAVSNPPDGRFLGDYAGVAATADRLYPVWADARAPTGELDLYVDRYANAFRYDEVDNLLFSDHETATFDTQDARFAQDVDYDVVSGLLSELRADAGFARAACLIDDLDAPPIVDTREPAPGDGFWYLVRADGPNGVGTFGDALPHARPNVRDSLDESVPTCP